MEIIRLHGWDFSPSEAIDLQKELASKVELNSRISAVRYIAGVDISVQRFKKRATGSVVVIGYPGLEVTEIQTVEMELEFPYIPGLLSFREMPVALEAFQQLKTTPDLVLVDGQGRAHPRRMGLGSHLGLFLNVPVIGCAKSRLCGSYEEPGTEAGDFSYLVDKEETIGLVVRTKTNVKPVFVSSGHMTDNESSMKWVLKCCRGYRLPEPTRLAHLAAGGNLKYPE